MKLPDDDQELAELAARQRKSKLTKLGIGVAVVFAGVMAVVPMGGAVATALAADGHTQVEVTRTGVFTFSYTSRQGESTCRGTVTRMPGSQTSSQSCIHPGGGMSISDTDASGNERGTFMH